MQRKRKYPREWAKTNRRHKDQREHEFINTAGRVKKLPRGVEDPSRDHVAGRQETEWQSQRGRKKGSPYGYLDGFQNRLAKLPQKSPVGWKHSGNEIRNPWRSIYEFRQRQTKIMRTPK